MTIKGFLELKCKQAQLPNKEPYSETSKVLHNYHIKLADRLNRKKKEKKSRRHCNNGGLDKIKLALHKYLTSNSKFRFKANSNAFMH